MKLLKIKPNTPGTRHQINLTKNLLAKKNNIYKKLIHNQFNFNGRSAQDGHITVWHKGGGCKKAFRQITFKSIMGTSIVLYIGYDPYRTSFVALNFNIIKKNFLYTLAPQNVYPGALITCTKKNKEFFFGNRIPLKNIPSGIFISNISANSNGVGTYIRAAGTFGQLIQKTETTVKIKFSSGLILNFSNKFFATLGRNSNIQHNLTIDGKAGRNRNRGLKPIVRGVAMNPVDHPHGGRTKGGRPSVTPWGILTKGKPTVKKYE